MPPKLGDRFDMRLEMYRLESRETIDQIFTLNTGETSLFSCY